MSYLTSVRIPVFLICLTAIFFCLLFFISNIFTVKTINLEGVNDLYGIRQTKGQNLILLNIKSVKENLYKLNPTFSELTITKKYPSTLQIVVKLSQKIALLRVDRGYYTLTSQGKVLSRTRSEKLDNGLTVISYYQNFNYDDYHVGDIIDQTDILTALLLLLELRKMNFVISRLDINGPDMLVFRTSENQEIKASSEKKLEEQLIDLKNLIVKIKVENINYKSIDLRFNKPVIRIR